MKKRYKILTIAVFCIFLLPSNAQQMEEPRSLLSPNVATLGTFREPDVALYTGTPSISIPLFEVPLQDYVLPIELQYNGTSILVDQRPSWVGLGWNLSAGGVITRKVNDEPDELKYTSDWMKVSYSYSNVGLYYNYSSLDTATWASFNLKGASSAPTGSSSYPEVYDTEPDEFHFIVPGYSGRFFLNHKGMWDVQCDKSVSVQVITPSLTPPFPVLNSSWFTYMKNQPPCFAGFIITTEDGTQFIFGNDTSAIDFCADFYEPEQNMTANAWHLTKIVLPNKQEMTLSYQRKGYISQMYHTMITRDEGVYVKWFGGLDLCSSSIGFSSAWDCINGKLLSPVYLKEITTPTLSVRFYISKANDLQDSSIVYTERLKFLERNTNEKYLPYLTNFTDYYGEGESWPWHYNNFIKDKLKRNKLDSIVIISPSSRQKASLSYTEKTTSRLALSEVKLADGGAYHFVYNSIEQLPKYLSFKSDHWGYYNNKSSFVMSESDINNYYSNRQPDSIYSKYGLMTRLYHPTGAVTRFEYESNDYQKQVKENRWIPLDSYDEKRFGGGVRIRKISHYENEDDEQPITTKEYFYTTNYIENSNSQISSGILGERFKYNYEYTELLYSVNGTIHHKTFSSISVLPGCGDDASICYSEVTEKLSSGGYNVYKFSSINNNLDELPLGVIQYEQLPYGKFSSKKINRGLLLSKTQYNSQKQLLCKTTFSYTPNKPASSFVRSVDWRFLRSCELSRCYQEGFTYKHYTHTMVPDTIREVTYSANGDSIVKTTKYTYDIQHQMPTNIKHISLTDTISEKITYPFDINPASVQGQNANAEAQTCNGMVENHYYLPWEITTFKSGKVVGSTCFHYSTYLNGQKTYYAKDSVSVLGITEPLTATSFNEISPSQKDDHYIVPAKQSCLYNENGNIIEITTDGIPVSYIWGYNNSYVVAKIVGLHYSQVQSVIPAYWFTEFNLSAGPSIGMLSAMRAEIKSHYPLAQCYAYQYNPLYGIISETDPRGQTLFYDYDAMGRLKEVYYKENNSKRVVKKYLYHHKTFSPIQLQ